jgi:hypothetical protein
LRVEADRSVGDRAQIYFGGVRSDSIASVKRAYG